MQQGNQRRRSYRVEHRGNVVRVLASVTDVYPHFTTLDPYVSRLASEGASGEVVLIDEATENVVARCPVDTASRKRAVRWRKQDALGGPRSACDVTGTAPARSSRRRTDRSPWQIRGDRVDG
jgi:hypothetical protein